jgi:hypothetical protein
MKCALFFRFFLRDKPSIEDHMLSAGERPRSLEEINVSPEAGQVLGKFCRIFGIGLLLLASSYGTAVNAADWRGDVVDPSGGMFSSMKFDVYGNAHVSYLDPLGNQLRYGFWDHILRKWFTTTLDRSAGFCSLALDSYQRPHISYQDYGGGLMYARWDGASWQKQKISIRAKEIGFYTSIALDQNDHPSIGFYEIDDAEGSRVARLRTVTWNGKFWALTTVDSTLGTGKFNSIAVDSQGHPHIAYATVNYENASLRYAYWNGESWKAEILEGEGKPGSSCWSVSMVLDKDDNPHITYTDVPHLLVKYATKKDGHWRIEAVDSLAREGYPDRNGIALDDQGNPYMSYYDAGAGLLKMAHRQGQRWATEVVDSGYAGLQSSLRIDHGVIWITYEARGALKFTSKPLQGANAPSSASVSR